MRTQILISILVVSAMAIAVTLASTGPISTRSSGPPKSDDPTQAIETIRKKYKLPALAVVVVKDGAICDRIAVGVRKTGDPTPITTNDVFHIGSCTKSMTATLAGMFIDEGKLRWDTTIADVFPELKGKMDKQYENVTVEQLLTHRGGVPEAPPSAAWKKAWKEEGTPMEQRREFIEAVLSKPPAVKPGTKMIYSNQGFVIVGAMLEKITGTAWETLITERLFKPLHMDTAGFGPPGTIGEVDQPWGHVRALFMNAPIQLDNPPAAGPAGRVHCSLDDFARYSIFQMENQPALLRAETFDKLHTAPAGSDYACGWVVMQRSWAGGKALWHNGSNKTFYFQVWLAPKKKLAIITATNTGADNAFDACDDADVYMIERWLHVKL
jgi:CubicO group peptidase (beta-lactamase class C family)